MAYHRKYKSPTDLMQDESLSTHEKTKMLNQWLEDEESRLRASGEGMVGKDRPDILKEVKKALISLQN